MADILTEKEKEFIDTEIHKANKHTDIGEVLVIVYEMVSKIIKNREEENK